MLEINKNQDHQILHPEKEESAKQVLFSGTLMPEIFSLTDGFQETFVSLSKELKKLDISEIYPCLLFSRS